MTNTERGRWGECLAANYLISKNIKIHSRNWRWNKFEVDLIGQTKDTWVFVEVKVRKWGFYQSAIDSVSLQKQIRVSSAAHHFIQQNLVPLRSVRFDIICVEYGRQSHRIHHIEDAFVCLPR